MSSSTGRGKRRRIIALGHYQNDLCFFCDQPVRYLDPETVYDGSEAHINASDVASYDHYISRFTGGSGRKENTVVAHRACNSALGHVTKSDALDEKLRLLNIRRGFGDANGMVSQEVVMSRLDPSTFAASSPALIYLCDAANAVEGEEGMRLRRLISRRLLEHINLINALRPIENLNFKREIIRAVRASRDAEQTIHLEYPFSTLVENVMQTMSKRATEIDKRTRLVE